MSEHTTPREIPDYPSRTVQTGKDRRFVPWEDWCGMQARALAWKEAAEALTSRVAALERETIERCVQVCKDTLAERETRLGIGGEYWDGYASMAKLIAARLSALALRATEQQQQGKP